MRIVPLKDLQRVKKSRLYQVFNLGTNQDWDFQILMTTTLDKHGVWTEDVCGDQKHQLWHHYLDARAENTIKALNIFWGLRYACV